MMASLLKFKRRYWPFGTPKRSQISNYGNDVSQLAFLTDEELWQAARKTLTLQEAERIQALTWKRQREGLTAEEQQETEHLLHRYNRIMLVQAKAAVLLKERGHDISSLTQEPPSKPSN